VPWQWGFHGIIIELSGEFSISDDMASNWIVSESQDWWMPMKLQVEYHEITITLPMSTTTLMLDYHNQPVSTIEQPFCSTESENPLHSHYQPSNYHGVSMKSQC
jgi:hypothetical protein